MKNTVIVTRHHDTDRIVVSVCDASAQPTRGSTLLQLDASPILIEEGSLRYTNQ